MITLSQIKSILNNADPQVTEDLAQRAKSLTEQYFGRTISLYAPLYLSNFCSSYCTYCGFNSHNRINRFKLTEEQMHKEMSFVADQGIENILLLTGESYKATPNEYLNEAVLIAQNYFPSIALEVHPMETQDYKELFETGVDGITVYQETYDRVRYGQVHLSGTKADYDFRYGTPERAAAGGIRSISMGILLGLADVGEDLFSLYNHLRFMEKTYPGVEYSLSFPRLREIKGEAPFPNSFLSENKRGGIPIVTPPTYPFKDEALQNREQKFTHFDVDDATFIKIICLTRILFPRVGINLSTREAPQLRDHALELGITRISAGSNTSVGGYTLLNEEAQDPQFDISDQRPVRDVIEMLKERNFDPILTDWRRIENRI